jgi:hypothetical protein
MLASGLALGLIAGLLAGGDLRRLATIQLRWWPVLVLAVVLRALASAVATLPWVLYIAAFGGIVAVALANARYPGMRLIAVGAALNLAVVALNAGMPVDARALEAAGASMPGDRLHIELSSATRLPGFADIIPVGIFRGVYSAGDVFLAAGAFWLPFRWMRRA